MSPLHETHRRCRLRILGAGLGTRRAVVCIPWVMNVRVTWMFARRRAPAPCIRSWLLERLQGLQIGAITHPILAMYTCPPTSDRLPHPSKEHRPRRRPVAFSASRIHEPLCDTASELPSTFQALIDSSKSKTSPGGMRAQPQKTGLDNGTVRVARGDTRTHTHTHTNSHSQVARLHRPQSQINAVICGVVTRCSPRRSVRPIRCLVLYSCRGEIWTTW
jgi:hypothetical protein